MRTLRIALAGVGKVGRELLSLLARQQRQLETQSGLRCMVVGLSDSTGTWLDSEGVDAATALRAKDGGTGFHRTRSLLEANPHVYVDATPTSLRSPQSVAPVRQALRRGIHCVLATKGPLVQAFGELASLSDWRDPSKPKLRFGGAVGSAIPSVNVGCRDLRAAQIQSLEGVLNLTTQRLLHQMSEGHSLAQAVDWAQQGGSMEHDPSMDVEGWDAAAKLVILVNAVLEVPATLAQVEVRGLSTLEPGMCVGAAQAGARVVLLASAHRLSDLECRLTVAPTPLGPEHPLARLTSQEQGVVFHSKLHGALTLLGQSLGPAGTAYAMLRDLLDIAQP